MPFKRESIEFLIENRLRNDKAWFVENRARFDTLVMEPLRALAVDLTDAAKRVDGDVITAPKVGKTLSRVYRDIRFSRDKSFFRDVMWVLFMRDRGVNFNPPGLVFEISPQGFRCGCGYYNMEPKLMQAVRQLIVENSVAFKRAQKAFAAQSVFNLEGEKYKSVRYAHSDSMAQEWMNRKSLCFIYSRDDFDLLFSDRLVDRIRTDFAALQPYYDFFMTAVKKAEDDEIHFCGSF